MANSYYTYTDTFTPGVKARSADIDREYNAIVTAFDQLPTVPASLHRGTSAFAGTGGGTGDAYEVTMPNTRTSNTDGDLVVFVADRFNTGPATLNVDGIGAVALRRFDDGALAANDLQPGLVVTARYSQGLGRFLMTNPSASYLTNASASASAASASAAAALISQGLAQEWASNAVDDDVSSNPGEFSALHWAEGAEQWATRAEDSSIPTSFGGPGFSAFHWAQKALGAAAGTSTILANIATATPPTSEAVAALLTYKDADETDELAELGFFAGVPAAYQIINRMHGGIVRVSGENSAGTLTTMINADPDGATTLYNNGVQTFNTFNGGITLRGVGAGDPDLGGAQNSQFFFTNNVGAAHGRIGSFSSSDFEFTNENHGGQVVLKAQDAGGVRREILRGDPDGIIRLYFAGLEKFRLLNTSVRIFSDITVATPPTTETPTASYDFVDSDSTDFLGKFGYFGSNVMVIENVMNGGGITLRGDDAGNVSRNMAILDPDNNVSLYYAGGLRARTIASGFEVRGSASAESEIELIGSGGSLLGTIGYDNVALDFKIFNNQNSGGVFINADNSTDVETNCAYFDPDAEAALYHAGNRRMITHDNGLHISGSAATDDPFIGFYDNTFTVRQGFLQVTNTAGVNLRSEVHGTGVTLSGENNAGAVNTLFLGDPDSAAVLYYAGLVRTHMEAGGIFTIRSDASTDAENRLLVFEHQDGVNRGYVGHPGGTALGFANQIHGGVVQLTAENAVGTEQTLLRGDPDGALDAYASGTKTFSVYQANRVRVLADIATATPPTTETPTAYYEFSDLDENDTLGRLGFEATSILRLTNLMHGGAVQLRAENNAGTNTLLVAADPDGATEIYHAGVKRFGTHTDVGSVNLFSDVAQASGAPLASQTAKIRLMDSDNTDLTGQIGHISSTQIYIRNMIHGAGVIIDGEDAGGAVKSMFNADPDGPVILYQAGNQAFRTHIDGIDIFDTSGVDPFIGFYDNLSTRQGYIQFRDANPISITGEAPGMGISIRGRNAGDTALHPMIVGDPDTSVDLYYNNSVKFATNNSGATVTGTLNVDTFRVDDDTTADTYTLSMSSGAAQWVGTGGVNTVQFGVTVLMNDGIIDQPVFRDYAVESQTETLATNAATFTYAEGNAYEIDLETATGNVTLTLSGGPPTGNYGVMEIKVQQDGTAARTITWAGGTFRWLGGAAHPMNSTLDGISIFVFETWDGGTTWYASGADYS